MFSSVIFSLKVIIYYFHFSFHIYSERKQHITFISDMIYFTHSYYYELNQELLISQ